MFAGHKSFSQLLQFLVDAESDVLTRLRHDILGSVLVVSVYDSPGVSEQNLHPFLAPEFLLV